MIKQKKIVYATALISFIFGKVNNGESLSKAYRNIAVEVRAVRIGIESMPILTIRNFFSIGIDIDDSLKKYR